MDSVDEIMIALSEKYAVERRGRWYLDREGGAIGKTVIFWFNNQNQLRSFLHDPCICPDNNQVERSVRAEAVYRNASFFKRSIEGAKGFCNLLTLRETAKLTASRMYQNGSKQYTVLSTSALSGMCGRGATRG